MLNAIIGFSIRNKLIVGLMVLLLIAVGAYQVTRLPIDAVPDITNNQVQVITVAPSFGATDIERLITFPVEQAISNIPGRKEMRSFSRFGLSLVTIVFEDDVDIYRARQQVAERLVDVQAQIPRGIGTPTLGPVTTGLGEIYQYTLKPAKGFESKYTDMDLRTLQDWVVRRQLLGVKGVADVSSFGGKLKQYAIEVAPNKLQAYGITITDVFNALEQNNNNTGGAYIEKGASVLYIRTEGLLANDTEIGNIAIKQLAGGTPLFIRDVAKVTTGYATRYGALTYNDEGEVAGAVVMMLKGANSSEVIKEVKAKIAAIQKTLPQGVIIAPFLDRTKMVDNAIGTVEKNLEEGALIVVFVLVLFLGNFRAGLLVASVIPLAMLFAISMMNLFGVSGNLMSLGALDFGLIVDGAVIIVEAVLHQLAHGHRLQTVQSISAGEMDQNVKKSAGKMMNSAVFGQIIILVVYLPIFTLQGIEGKMFRPMAQTVAFALLGAFLLSLTYIPMMSALVLSKRIKHKPNLSDHFMQRLEHGYHAALSKALGIPRLVLLTVVILFAGAIAVLTTLGGEFIPTLEEGDFAVETRMLSGSSLTATIAATQKAAYIIKSRFPEVEKVVCKIGSSEIPTDPMPMDACDMIIVLKDKKDWTSAHNYSDLAKKMSEAVSEVPGITTSFQFPVQMRFNELMTGARQDVVCKIFGENLDTLARYANQLGGIVRQVKGAQNLYVETVEGLPQILISANRSALAQYNIPVETLNKIVNAALAGQYCGVIYEGEKRFDIVVKLAGDQKKDLDDIRNILIPTGTGTQVPLSLLAAVDIKEGPYQIQREESRRRITIGFNTQGRDVQTIVNELQHRVESEMHLPAGYTITYGGVFENLVAAKERLLIAVPVSLLLIFLLLYFAFNNLRHALLIYSAIPLSAIGGIFFLALRGMPFSISAGVGFIALFGVAVLNGIVLIAEFNRLKLEGTIDTIAQVILKGANTRLRPVLMTAFVASLGFLPMALSNGAGAEVQRPLATVVIGGLLIATFLTLFVLPVLYLLFEKKMPKKQPTAKVTTLLVVLVLLGFTGRAQTPITLQAAIDSAVQNNLQLRNATLREAWQHALIATGNGLPATAITGEAGQINSAYTDTRFTIAQSFALPVFYRSQRQALREEAGIARIQRALQQKELIREVKSTYYHYLYLQNKQQLLQYTDSVYQLLYNRAQLRYSTGETDILEKTSAAARLAEIALQRDALEQDMKLVLLQFQLLINTTVAALPAPAAGKYPTPVLLLEQLTTHPFQSLYEQTRQLSIAQLRLEKARMLPDLTLAYSNTSIRGVGADEKLYGAGTRFSAVQVGVALPVFRRAQRARVAAAGANVTLANGMYEAAKQQLTSQSKQAMVRSTKANQTAARYETELLPDATLMLKTANLKLANGAINYLEWMMLVNQALGIRNDYLDAIKEYNESFIQLEYYNN